MFDTLKRLFGGASRVPEVPLPEAWEAIRTWAVSRRYAFRTVGEDGFAIDDPQQGQTGQTGQAPWRLQWGPSQRNYIEGAELRLRCDLRLGSELQCLLMERALQQRLEAAVFDEYVEGVQTRIDNETPPEVRWLVMFPKLSGTEMPALRERYVALSSIKPWLLSWLSGPLTEALAALSADPDAPVVLMISRGRLTLRTAMASAELRPLQARVRLFECALREARRVMAQGPLDVDSGTTAAGSSSRLSDGDSKA